jgi:hypothetical protein
MFHADCGKMRQTRIHLNNAERMFKQISTQPQANKTAGLIDPAASGSAET